MSVVLNGSIVRSPEWLLWMRRVTTRGQATKGSLGICIMSMQIKSDKGTTASRSIQLSSNERAAHCIIVDAVIGKQKSRRCKYRVAFSSLDNCIDYDVDVE